MELKSESLHSASVVYTSFVVVFLGLLSAFAPFVTDMYLPTLPSLGDEFNTSASMIQLGLTTSLVGLAIGQLFFGPLSDKYGRKSMLAMSIMLFCIATVLCVFSRGIEMFLAMRFFQGIGASGGIVLSRSVAADLYRGRQLAKMMAIIGAVNGVAPVVAPVIGGVVASFAGWQGIFMVLLAIGLLLLMMNLFFHESLSRSMRATGSILSMMGCYRDVFANREFMAYATTFAMSQGVLFAYIAAAPFIVQHNFGFDEMQFSVVFGINALAIGLGSAMSMRFKTMQKASHFGTCGMLVMAVAMLVSNLTLRSFWGYEVATWFMLLAMGFVFTGATTVAMDKGRDHIGAASATVGASGFIIGGLVSPLVGIGDVLIASPVVCICCALVAMITLRSQSK